MDCMKNTKIVGTNSTTLLKLATCNFLKVKTNSKRTQFKRKNRVPTSHFSAFCDELAPDFLNVGHQSFGQFVPVGLVLPTEFPAVAFHPFRPCVFEDAPPPRRLRPDHLPGGRFSNLHGQPFG